MERLIGSMTALADGGYAGMLRSALIRTHIELRPGPVVEGERTFSVYAGVEFAFGDARQPADDDVGDIVLDLDAPELPRPIALRAHKGEGDEWHLLWTPRTTTSPRR